VCRLCRKVTGAAIKEVRLAGKEVRVAGKEVRPAIKEVDAAIKEAHGAAGRFEPHEVGEDLTALVKSLAVKGAGGVESARPRREGRKSAGEAAYSRGNP